MMKRFIDSFERVGRVAINENIPEGWRIKSVNFQEYVPGQLTVRAIHFVLENEAGETQSGNCGFDIREERFNGDDQLDGLVAVRCGAAARSATELIEYKAEKEAVA